MSPLGKPAGRPQAVGTSRNSGGHVSFRMSDAEAGGLMDDINAEVVLCEAVTWDYMGKAEPAPALHLQLKADDGAVADQYYSAGKLERMVPSDDGNFFDPAQGSSAKGLNSNSNAFVFLASLIEKGFPEQKIEEGGLGAIVGTYAHFNRIPQKSRAGLDSAEPGARAKTVLVVTKVLKLPWETKGKTGTATTGKTAAPKAGTNGSGINDEAIEAVKAVLAANGGAFTEGKTKLGMACFRSIPSSNPNRAKILKLVPTEEFLTADGMPWVYDPEDESVTATE